MMRISTYARLERMSELAKSTEYSDEEVERGLNV
jgi:hypothetical protein